MKRFISEYAKFKKQNIAKNQLMQKQIKDERIKKIVRVENLADRGLLSVDEAMRSLADIR